MDNKGVSCRKSGNTLEFTWKDNKVLLDPTVGGRIKSLGKR